MAENFEWLGLRRGLFTASNFGKLVTHRDKGADFLTDGAKTYATKTAIELLTLQDTNDKGFKNYAMQWGSNTEAEAVEAVYQKHGLVVEKYGDNQEFVALNKDVGCTPDGLIDDDAGIETKCPESETHAKYLQLKTVDDFKKACGDYWWQIQGCLYVTGREKWLFVSYDPRFLDERLQLKVMVIYRDENDIEFLESRLKLAVAYRNEVYDNIVNVNLGIVHNKHKQAENA